MKVTMEFYLEDAADAVAFSKVVAALGVVPGFSGSLSASGVNGAPAEVKPAKAPKPAPAPAPQAETAPAATTAAPEPAAAPAPAPEASAPAAPASATLDDVKKTMADTVSRCNDPAAVVHHLRQSVPGFTSVPNASPEMYPALISALQSFKAA